MSIGVDVSTQRVHVAEVVGSTADGLRSARALPLASSIPAPIYFDALRRVFTEECESDDVWLEEPWLRGDSPASVRSILKQHRAVYRVEAAAELAGKAVHFVAVPTWRSIIFAQGRMNPKQNKDFSIWYAKAIYGRDVGRDHNLADAIAIATYGYSVSREALMGGNSK